MRPGRVSRTALKVALLMVTLGQKDEWRARLPVGVPELSERLLLAAGVRGSGSLMVHVNKLPLVYRISLAYESRMPGTFTGIGERKIFVNERVLAAVEGGATQVLNLGAGFDTLCLRLAPRYPLLRFFEVDHPATAAAKAVGVDQIGRPANLVLAAADLHRRGLSGVLRRATGWDADARSIVVAEGFFLYWTAADVRALFAEIAACTGPGSQVVFSYGNQLDQHRLANALLRLVGEPWLSSCTTAGLVDYVGPCWSVVAAREAPSPRHLEGFAVVEKA